MPHNIPVKAATAFSLHWTSRKRALFAFAFLGERPAAREWAGIAMVAGGVLLLALKR